MIIDQKQIEETINGINESGGSGRLEELFEAFLRIEYAMPESISVSFPSKGYSTSGVTIDGKYTSGLIVLEKGAALEKSKLPQEATVRMNQYKLWQNNGTQQSKNHYYTPDWDIDSFDPELTGVIQVIKEKESARTIHRWPQIYNPDKMGAEVKVYVKPATT